MDRYYWRGRYNSFATDSIPADDDVAGIELDDEAEEDDPEVGHVDTQNDDDAGDDDAPE